METLSASTIYSPPPAGHSQPSRDPTSPKATRATTASAHHPRYPPPSLSAPASQESIVSVQSAASSVAPRLQDSETNLSQITSYTDVTSPSSSLDHASHPSKRSQLQRNKTPDNTLQPPQCNGDSGLAFASPMSTVSPATANGAKRTASGHVKNTPSLSSTPYTTNLPGRNSRRDSTSSSGSRAGELAATLKTRLGYAMAKVQHGWEHKPLHEVEQLALFNARHGNSQPQPRPGTSGLSNGTARMSMYDDPDYGGLDVTAPPPSKRHSGTYASFAQSSQAHPTHPYNQAPTLQPAADIRPTSSSRPYPAPSLHRSTQQHSNAMSPPRTPINSAPPRPPTIRTETQTIEAERDALQALFQLGSPHTSQMPRGAYPTSSHASPPRGMLDTPRRVVFARSESNSSARPSSSGSSAAQDYSTRYVESQR